MKKCTVCGSEFNDGSLFCPECGSKLEEIFTGRTESQKDGTVGGSVSSHGTRQTQEPISAGKTTSAQTPKSSSSAVLPVTILSVLVFVSFIAAVVFFFQMNDYSRRLDTSRQAENNMRRESEQAKSELEQVKSELAECQNAFVQAQLDLEQTRNDFVEIQMELEQYDGLGELYGYGSENYYAEEKVVIMETSASRDLMIYANINGKIRFHGPGAGVSCKWGEWAGGHRIPLTITGNSEGVYTIKFTNDQNSDSFEILVIVTDKD